MNNLIKPFNITPGSYFRTEYDAKDIDNFVENLNIVKNIDLVNKNIYLDKKGISQDKIRNAGIKIKRAKADADIIIIDDIRKYGNIIDDGSTNSVYSFSRSSLKTSELENYFDTLISEEQFGYTYMFVSDFYKTLYKYDGNKELFTNLLDLLQTKNHQNVQMAMEMMTNANWDDNKIYLKELFNLYWYSTLSVNRYKTSVNFNGFLMSLDFNYKNVNYYHASHYQNDCITQEHHEFVFNKYDTEFKTEFNELMQKYKVKIDEFKYSINFDKIKDDE